MNNYEQKYKKALEAVKFLQEVNPSDEGIQNWVKDNFPELKESEDERIRKTLIAFFRDWERTKSHCWNVNVSDILTWLEKAKALKAIKPIFKTGDEVYNRFDKSLGHVVIESVDDTTYYGDTTNFDITDQDQWGIVRSCENCQCGHYICKSKKYNHHAVSCYLHEDCGGDEPIIIPDDDFVETAMTCKEFEQEN
jgi:hypothetical protein